MPTFAAEIPISPSSAAEADTERLLELLTGEPAGVITIAAMRKRGIQAPAQAVYALQVAGHRIDRVSLERPDGSRARGYRLRSLGPPPGA